MENKKILNRLTIILSTLIILTFAVFYKHISNVSFDSTWVKILYFGVLYASIICSGLGLIICFMNAFKDQFDLIWFVQFLNFCAFALILGLTLFFAFTANIAINLVFLAIVCEYFLINLIGTIILICSNFKYFKKDFASLFKSGEPDKSYRYGLEEPKKSKAEKYSLLENENNQAGEVSQSEPNEENPESKEVNEALDGQSENSDSENQAVKNSEEQEITKEQAQELSDTIINTEENPTNELAEIENSIEVQNLIKESMENNEPQEEVKVFNEDEVKIETASNVLSEISDDEIVAEMESTPISQHDEADSDNNDDLENHLPLDEDSTIPENEKYSEISEHSEPIENEAQTNKLPNENEEETTTEPELEDAEENEEESSIIEDEEEKLAVNEEEPAVDEEPAIDEDEEEPAIEEDEEEPAIEEDEEDPAIEEESIDSEKEKYSEISEQAEVSEATEEIDSTEVNQDKQASRENLESKKEEKISKLFNLIKKK